MFALVALLAAIGTGIVFVAAATAAVVTAVDDAGADDEPGQKDLNALAVDYGSPGATSINVEWNWDDTATSGANTRDGCSLFDTDGDGFANYAFCVTVASDGTATYTEYVCTADSRADRCGGPSAVTTFASTASASIVASSDPFGVPSSPYYDANHVTGNTCDAKPGCYTDDTVADATIVLADFGGATAKLINVCSYPSQEPNSDPSDCVWKENSGFLTIVKVASPNDGTAFVFDASASSTGGDSSWTINGSGSVELIPYEATATLDLSEVVPSGWQLDSASCAIQSSPPAGTGTSASTGVDNLEIKSGLETKCTFTDSKTQGYFKIKKEFSAGTSGFTGNFSITYNCGAGDQTVSLAAGATSAAIGPFDTGTSCAVTEPTLPTPPTNWSFGTPSISGSPVTIVKDTAATTTSLATVTNSISRDTGSLTIKKVVTGAPTGFTGSFGVRAVCTNDGGTYNRTISYSNDGNNANDEATITGIPTGNTCTVTETSKADAPTGYSWGTETISPTPSGTINTITTPTVTVTNIVNGRARLIKTTNGVESQTMTWSFQLKGPYPPGTATESKTIPPTDSYFTTGLTPGATYRVCETGIPAGWTTRWTIGGVIVPFVAAVNNDPVDSATGYSRVFDPNYVAPPATYTNDTRCVNFTVAAGTTITIAVDNSRPGGEPRTIGFWKNWSSCTGGLQVQVAEKNGGPSAGWYTLDDLLNDPGYTIGILVLDDGDCLQAVRILDKSDIVTGKKKASDAAYNLAAQFLAAQLNLSAGAETCTAVVNAVNSAQTLLAGLSPKPFNGTGDYLRKGTLYNQANTLASTLDQYNNGFLCP